jgi:hypothetical protein
MKEFEGACSYSPPSLLPSDSNGFWMISYNSFDGSMIKPVLGDLPREHLNRAT